MGAGVWPSNLPKHENSSGTYFHGGGLYDNGLSLGLGLWGGSGNALPDLGSGTGAPPGIFVTSTGRVGINKSSPSHALDAVGNLNCSGNIVGVSIH